MSSDSGPSSITYYPKLLTSPTGEVLAEWCEIVERKDGD